jgi:transcriptional regulator with XRE-family HTH domain
MTDSTLGSELRTLRLRAGLSGAALAGMVGRSQSWVSRIEHNRTVPALDDLERIAKACNASDDELARLVELHDAMTPRKSPTRAQRETIASIETLLGLLTEQVQKLK